MLWCAGVRVPGRRPGQQQVAGRRVAQAPQPPRRAPEQLAVRHRQVGGQDDGVAGEAVAVRGVHRDRPVAAGLDRSTGVE
jgi:hypothetical protein